MVLKEEERRDKTHDENDKAMDSKLEQKEVAFDTKKSFKRGVVYILNFKNDDGMMMEQSHQPLSIVGMA